MRKHTPSPFKRLQNSSTKTRLYVHSLKLINIVLLLVDTKSNLLFKDDINNVLLMEATKYSARKKHLVIPNLSNTGHLNGITITFKTLDTLGLE